MTLAFRDPAEEPTRLRIQAALGAAAAAWDGVVELVSRAGLELAWRYYRDGGWLARASRGRKTIAWVSVATGSVKLTCYFTERHRRDLMEDGALSAALRARIGEVPLVGRLLPVTVEVRDRPDLREADALLRLKLAAG